MEINKKKIIFFICNFLLIIILAFAVWYNLCSDHQRGEKHPADYDAAGNAEQAANSADRAAERLDDTENAIKHAGKVGNSITAEISSSRESVAGSAEEVGRITSGIDECQSIVEKCESRNREIAEIIGSLTSTGEGTPDREQTAKERK